MNNPQKATQALSIPFIDLKAQQERIRSNLDAAIKRVLDHGHYIMGPEVFELERQLSTFCGVKHAITCANGTDALALGLMAKNIGPGDAVFVPSFTFAATAEVVVWLGASPVFIDVLPDTYNLDPASLLHGIAVAQKAGLRPRGIIPVDLFGQPADYARIQEIAEEFNLWIMADAAQSFGATDQGKQVGSLAEFTTTSFFPAKPLGCYGDGGALFTDSDALAEVFKSLRVHGQGQDKYDNVRIGMNGRLDTLQAAILLEKLKVFPEEIHARAATAEIYTAGLKDIVQTPYLKEGATSAWAQYTICLSPGTDRAQVMNALKEQGIPTMIYYIKPLHQQTAYTGYLTATKGALPICETLAQHVVSLPMSGYVREAERIVESVRRVLGARA